MFKRIRNALSSSPTTVWVAQVISSGFIVSSKVEPKQYPKKEETSHNLTLEFEEPVRDGNDVSHLNFKGDNGEITHQYELFSGQESLTLNLNPRQAETEIVTVTTGDEVRDTSILKLWEETVDTTE